MKRIIFLLLLSAPGLEAQCAELENLAPQATISATSRYSKDYGAANVADGKIPAALGRQDLGQAWCVQGRTHRNGAELVFLWKDPVVVEEIIYFGRTAWSLDEGWKDYEVRVDQEIDPVACGRLEMVHGAQRIALDSPRKMRSLTMKFKSSHGGHNPGVSEIMIFSGPVPDRLLASFTGNTPHMGRVDPVHLGKLVKILKRIHGSKYTEYEEHLSQVGRAAPETQKEALLFDVDRLLVIKRHEIVASHVYTYHYEGFKPGGGLYVISLSDPDSEPLELAASPSGQILDCDLDCDGKTVLFSWRKKEDEGYHIYTVDIDGSNLTQLTGGAWHDYNGCWLPDGGIAFLSTRSAQFAYCWHAPVGVVHRMERDGSLVRALSANYLNDFTPYPLEDGRIIYTRWEYVDRPAIPIQSLWTMNPDGTGLSVYYGNRVLSPGTFMEARPIPGTDRIICTMTGHNGPTRGAIGVIDRKKGVNAQAAIRNITPDVPIPGVNEGNGNTAGSKQYSFPFPLDEFRFLVSIRGPVLVRTIDGTCQSIALEAPRDGMQYFCAQPVRPRIRPAILPSSYPQETQQAALYIQDVYRGLEPHVGRGEVKKIRVVQEMQKTVRIDPKWRAFGFQFPVISCGATYAGKKVLGEVDVELDGSAYFKVPSQTPIYFMALDDKGRAVQRMRSFTHLMPGERQGCVGCHESRRTTPEARRTRALEKEPQELKLPEWGTAGFDYSRIVQPLLDHYCHQCHNPVDAPRGIDLSAGKTDFFNVSYDVLARENQGPKGSPYVNWIPTYNGQEQNILETTPGAWGPPRSRLADLVLNNHPDSDGKTRFVMDEKSRRTILAWIDLNAPYYGTSETAWPDAIGCRRIYPEYLDEVLARVARTRCASCHEGGEIPRRDWTRITEPELNPFLLAPLAKEAGGSQKCGAPVFQNKEDPDYRAILKTFEQVQEKLRDNPRMDMPGGKPSSDLCRDCR